jgi:methyltransferase
MIAYLVLILATGVERLVEVVISTRHARWAFARGGVEFGQKHFPWMVALHTALLVGALAEVFLLDRPFLPWLIWALGEQWNTRVIVVPGLSRVTRGPYRYRWLPHPNYLIVVAEGIALPLVHSAWITAIVFTVLNAILLLKFRIPTEDRALRSLVG